MSTKITFTSYKKDVKKKIDVKTTRMLTAIGIFLVANMKLLVPVDTGRLKSSLSYQVISKALTFGASSSEASGARDVFYFTLIELGTRFSKAQPFVRPSVFDHVDDIERLAKQEFYKG